MEFETCAASHKSQNCLEKKNAIAYEYKNYCPWRFLCLGVTALSREG
jgi:hypothetical protein